jgi:hypothetical protein
MLSASLHIQNRRTRVLDEAKRRVLFMNSFHLSQYDLTVAEIYRNLPPCVLYEHAIRFDKEATIAENGALVAYSGEKTTAISHPVSCTNMRYVMRKRPRLQRMARLSRTRERRLAVHPRTNASSRIPPPKKRSGGGRQTSHSIQSRTGRFANEPLTTSTSATGSTASMVLLGGIRSTALRSV